MDIELIFQGDLWENNSGQLTFNCFMCNANNLGLFEIVHHLKSHDDLVTADIYSETRNIITEADEFDDRISSLRGADISRDSRSTENDLSESMIKSEPNEEVLSIKSTELIPNGSDGQMKSLDVVGSDETTTKHDYKNVQNVWIKENHHKTDNGVKSPNQTISILENNVNNPSLDASNNSKLRKSNNQYNNNYLPTFDQFKCDICGRVFTRKSCIYIHLRIVHSNHRPCICNICGGGFKLPGDLRRHLNRHNDVKKHTCEECGHRFISASDLRKHMTMHTGVKEYLCTECGKRYKNRSALAVHEQYVHMEVHDRKYPERKHKCDHPGCNRSYFGIRDLTTHKRIHTGERPLSCNVCNKNFARPASLREHLKLHNPDKMYQCKFCPSKFSQSSTRRKHEKRVHTSMYKSVPI